MKPYGVPLGPRGHEAVVELLNLSSYVPKRGTRRATLVGVGTGTVWKWARAAGEGAGCKVWVHLLRHVAITRLAEDPTVDVRTIMAIANWSEPSLLERYAAKSEAGMRRAANVL